MSGTEIPVDEKFYKLPGDETVEVPDLKQHYDVIITTPGHSMNQHYVISLTRTIKELERRGITWLYLSQYSSDVACAREWTILGKGQPKNDWLYNAPAMGIVDYNKIFLIDSDIEWDPEDFIKLYESEFEAVSGVYLQANGVNTTLTSTNYMQGQFTRDEIMTRKEPFEVRGAGMGFVCIKKGIFEAIDRPWFTHMVEEMPTTSGKIWTKTYSEDISFVMKMNDYGFKLMVEPSVRVAHIKTVRVSF